ncbi:hypothetical protein BDV96DRAFT_650654 [Lophiotrema nucula]|uniref:Ankyrin repeat-containing domain protein n=1 Tax=Lophiotrema nucula TaxID=690887 RepID=A0A6A5YU53_9PLEO|nr:hypothetical protein BDV96DRAFT_650654 [Lophiotrema nucula]
MEYGCPNSLQHLLERGARLYHPRREVPVMQVVARRGHLEVLQLMRSSTLTKMTQRTALVQAVKFGDVELAKQLIELGDMATTIGNSKLWLRWAVATGKDDMIQLELSLPGTE